MEYFFYLLSKHELQLTQIVNLLIKKKNISKLRTGFEKCLKNYESEKVFAKEIL